MKRSLKKWLAPVAALICLALSCPAYAWGNPATGDNSQNPVWLYVIIVVAAIGIAAALILPYLKKEKLGKTQNTPGEDPQEPKE